MLSLNDPIRVVISGIEFRGIGNWSDEDGFTAELTGLLSKAAPKVDNKLSTSLRITINEAERGILLRPYLAKAGGMAFKSGNPITTTIELRAEGIVRKLPWNIKASSKVTRLQLTSAAVDLWYGEETAKIERDHKTLSISAQFKATEESSPSDLGDFKVGLSITGPGTPVMGDYNFRTQPYVLLKPKKSLTLLQALETAYAMEGCFELLAGFPQRRFGFEVRLDTWPDHDVPFALASGPQRKTTKDHPFSLFIHRAHTPNIGKIFAGYHRKHKELLVMQNTIRYLSGNRIVLPEGFLTACNVIESIGKLAPNSNASLPALIKQICKTLKSTDKAIAKRFHDEVANKVPKNSSFKDRFEFVKSILDAVGVPIVLEYQELRNVRAAYRHDIIELKQKDFEVMGAGIGLAWFLGLIWMCREIGIPDSVLKPAASRDLFHDMRGTGRNLWGKHTPPKSETAK